MERSADNRPLEIVIQSIDHQLGLLNTELYRSLEVTYGKMERLKEATVLSTDCEKCQQATKDTLKELKASMKDALQELKDRAVDKYYFLGMGGALGLVIIILGVWTNWDKLVR